jgi:threonine/homoserine/homoserine lactone efflux protein
MLSYVLQGLLLGSAAAFQPGPLQAYLILQSLKHGRRVLVYALVPLLSDLPIIAAVLFILAVLPPAWVIGLRLIGGLFLLYLAGGAIRTARRLADTAEGEPPSHQRGLFRAVMINLLNPNPYLFWSTVAGPILITGWRIAPAYGLAMLATFYGIMVAINAAIILVVSTTRQWDLQLRKWLMILSAIGLGFFGLYQLWLGIRGWMA